jgi:methyltransferase (TIGR00027 family)
MRRRAFLYGLTAGALGACQTSTPVPPPVSPTPSLLAEGKPSETALGTAIMRAAHQLIDIPKIFDDPLALKIIGAEAEAVVQRTFGWGPSAPLRPFVAVRSRFTEDELAKAVQRGVRQYVVLGAGLDTFAYRNPYPASRLHVFEVDHPSTQVWKRANLKDAGIAVPASLTFAAIDFETQTLAGGLQQAGFKADEPTFFSMLGVVIYLTRDAAMATLAFIAARPAGSEIVFDYAIDPSSMNEKDRFLHDRMAQHLAARGEPFVSYFAPATLAADLRRVGFTRVEDLGPDEIHARYFKGRTDGLRVNGMARLVKATN